MAQNNDTWIKPACRSMSRCANFCGDIIRIICDYSTHEDIYTLSKINRYYRSVINKNYIIQQITKSEPKYPVEHFIFCLANKIKYFPRIFTTKGRLGLREDYFRYIIPTTKIGDIYTRELLFQPYQSFEKTEYRRNTEKTDLKQYDIIYGKANECIGGQYSFNICAYVYLGKSKKLCLALAELKNHILYFPEIAIKMIKKYKIKTAKNLESLYGNKYLEYGICIGSELERAPTLVHILYLFQNKEEKYLCYIVKNGSSYKVIQQIELAFHIYRDFGYCLYLNKKS